MLTDEQKLWRWMPVSDYDSAKEYLSQGRNPLIRPLYHKGLHVRDFGDDGITIGYKEYGDGNIGLRWSYVTYLPDNKAVIHPRVLNWPSGRDVVTKYANIPAIWKRNNKIYIAQSSDTFTPTKEVICPKCSGMGKFFWQCDGVRSNARYLSTTGKWVYGDYHGHSVEEAGKPHRVSTPCPQCDGHRKVLRGGKRQSMTVSPDTSYTVDLTTGFVT